MGNRRDHRNGRQAAQPALCRRVDILQPGGDGGRIPEMALDQQQRIGLAEFLLAAQIPLKLVPKMADQLAADFLIVKRPLPTRWASGQCAEIGSGDRSCGMSGSGKTDDHLVKQMPMTDVLLQCRASARGDGVVLHKRCRFRLLALVHSA